MTAPPAASRNALALSGSPFPLGCRGYGWPRFAAQVAVSDDGTGQLLVGHAGPLGSDP